jgi:hypothetical protein
MPALLSEPPSELRLRPGETSRFRVGGAGPAGYGWSWTIDGDAKCISVDIETAPTDTPVARGELQSSSRDHFILVRAVHPGKATLHLKLARSFQPSRPPMQAYTVAITITAS